MTPEELANLLEARFPAVVKGTQVGVGRVRAVLMNDSFLDIWFNDRGRYSYHWQREDGAIYRFNNAPYHPSVPTHPHHMHHGQQDEIRPSPVRGVSEEDVNQVLTFIEQLLGTHL